MNFIKLVAPFAMLALTGLVGCGGPEGTWKLDKDAMKAEAEKEAKGDEKAKELASKMMEKFEMTLELKKDGKYDAKISMPSFKEEGKTEDKTESGTWKAEGENITLKDDKDEIKCKLEGSKMTCTEGKQTFVFKKG